MTKNRKSRRAFLKGAAAGSVAASTAVAAPAIAAGKFRWKMVTTWPKNFPGVGIAAQRVADRIGALSDGRLTIKLFAAGEFVPPFEVFDAVRDGKAECGHDAPYYWIAKNRSVPFFCTVPGGLTPQEHNAWIQFGGGQELWDEMYAEFGLRAWLAGNAGTQMIGWFRNPITSVDDLSGLKIRMAGLHAEVFNRLGATSVNMAGGEIMPALQSGLIDAAEWGGPWMDLAFGFYKVAKYCYGPGVHEPGAAQSLVVNLKAYEALPADLKEIVRAAADVETVRLLSEFTVMNALARQTLINEHGVTMEPLPTSLLKRWFEVSEEVVGETAAEGDLNRRIYDNWTKFRQAVIDFGPFAEFGYMNARML